MWRFQPMALHYWIFVNFFLHLDSKPIAVVYEAWQGL